MEDRLLKFGGKLGEAGEVASKAVPTSNLPIQDGNLLYTVHVAKDARFESKRLWPEMAFREHEEQDERTSRCICGCVNVTSCQLANTLAAVREGFVGFSVHFRDRQ